MRSKSKLFLDSKLPRGIFRSVEGHCDNRPARTKFRSPTYQSWYNMIIRCYRPSKKNPHHIVSYKDVYVCTDWVESFENFLQSMGSRPRGKTIDRIDPHGHYTPDNCRWATRRQQDRNKRGAPAG